MFFSMLSHVDRWFGYAEDRVPQLVSELHIGGIQKPERKAKSGARSFDVGEVQDSDKGVVGLRQPLPVILLDRFETGRRLDPAGLTKSISDYLSNAPSRALVYWPNVNSFPGAYRLVGNYSLENNRITAECFLQKFTVGSEEPTIIEQFQLSGEVAKLGELTRSIVERAEMACNKKAAT